MIPDPEPLRTSRQGPPRDKAGARLGQVALGPVRKDTIEMASQNELQHRVTEEFEALVVGRLALLLRREARMRQGLDQQRLTG